MTTKQAVIRYFIIIIQYLHGQLFKILILLQRENDA